MSCQPNDLLIFAEGLLGNESEAALRASISRAYYAAYHVASDYEAYLPIIDHDQKRGGTHKQLIDKFLHLNTDKKLRPVGYMLKDMCNRREFADYHLADKVNQSNATYQVEAAKRVLKALMDYSESLVTDTDQA